MKHNCNQQKHLIYQNIYPQITHMNTFDQQQNSNNDTQQDEVIEHNYVNTINSQVNCNIFPTNVIKCSGSKYDSREWSIKSMVTG